jgi:hypothetical protein
MKRALAVLVVALLVFALAGVLLVKEGKAAYLTDLSPKIIIESPAEKAVYPSGIVPLILSVLPNY